MNRWTRKTGGREFIKALVVVLALVHASAGQAFGQEPGDTPASRPGAPITDSEKQAYGCLTGVGTATALTLVGGPTETVLVVAGGVLVPTSLVVLWLSLTGTVLAAVCAGSALATPGIIRLWDYYHSVFKLAPPLTS